MNKKTKIIMALMCVALCAYAGFMYLDSQQNNNKSTEEKAGEENRPMIDNHGFKNSKGGYVK